MTILIALLLSVSSHAADSKSDCMKKEAGQYFQSLAAVDEDVLKGSLSETAAAKSRIKISQTLEEKVLACGGEHLPEAKKQVSMR